MPGDGVPIEEWPNELMYIACLRFKQPKTKWKQALIARNNQIASQFGSIK